MRHLIQRSIIDELQLFARFELAFKRFVVNDAEKQRFDYGLLSGKIVLNKIDIYLLHFPSISNISLFNTDLD